MDRREFLNVLAIASAAGLPISSREALAAADGTKLYDIPRSGNVSLLHMTDLPRALIPSTSASRTSIRHRGARPASRRYLVGEHLLRLRVTRGSGNRNRLTHLDFPQAARTYGMIADSPTSPRWVRDLKASRPGALLLDGGDTCRGRAHALWSNGQVMVDACKALAWMS